MKNLLRQILLIIIFAIVPLSLAFFSYHNPKNAVKDDAVSLFAKEKTPARLKIPKLGIEAQFEHVGLTPEGRMDVPKSRDTVAWFGLGPTPGDIGSAVISGHSGYKDNKRAVFDNLSELRKGDKVYVEDEKGVMSTFVVREFQTYNATAYAPEVFASSDGKSHLNLITCTGDWNEVEKTHSDRLIVFTDKE